MRTGTLLTALSGALLLTQTLGAQQLRYATYFGGTGISQSTAVRAPDGSIIVAGVGSGFDFPLTRATLRPASARAHLFVAKIDIKRGGPEALLYSSFFAERSNVVALAAVGDLIYIAGNTASPDFPVTAGAFQDSFGIPAISPPSSVFFCVLDPSRTGADALVYSTYLGGPRKDTVAGMSVDQQGRASLWGQTDSDSFPITPDAFNAAPRTGFFEGDHWVARIDPSKVGAASLDYSSLTPVANVVAVQVDGRGRFHLLARGGAEKLGPPGTPGAFRPDCFERQGAGVCQEGYYALLDPSLPGSEALRYGTFLGRRTSSLLKLTVGAESQVWIGGTTDDPDFFSTGPSLGASCPQSQPNCSAINRDVFLMRIDPDAAAGESLKWSARIGGEDLELLLHLASDGSGGVYAAGSAPSLDFPVTDSFDADCPAGDATCARRGLFLLHINPSLAGDAALDYSVVLSSDESSTLGLPGGLALDASGALLLAGWGRTPGFQTTPGAFDAESGGPLKSQRTFLVRIDPAAQAGERLRLSTFWGAGAGQPQAPQVSSDGLILLASVIGRPDAATTIGAFDRTCGFGVVGPQGSCSRNTYLALIDPTDGQPVSLDTSPIQMEYRIPETPPAVEPRPIQTPSALRWTGTAESDSGWLQVDRTTIEGGVVQAILRPGGLAWGLHRGRIRVASEDPVIRRDIDVVLTVEGPPPGEPAGVVSAASFQAGPVAPGQIISIFGSGFGPASGRGPLVQDGRVTANLGRVFVEINGGGAPILFAGHGQINAILPYRIGDADTFTLTIVTPQGRSPEITLATAPTAPALFTANGSGVGPAAALNQDGRLNSAANPARRGEALVLFGTGEGRTTPEGSAGLLVTDLLEVDAEVRVLIGGAEAEVLFAGPAPGFAGLLQVNTIVPPDAPAGASPIELRIGGRGSPPGVTASVE